MRRREFFGHSAAAALGFSFSPLPGWPQDKPSEKKNDLAAPAPSFDILIRNLEQQTPNVLDENFVPGLAIVLIRNGKAGWHRAFGVRDSESKKPVDDGTIFEAASMGKPVFAYAVMKLCERGVLNLDTPLTRYTPERYLEGDPRLDLITARHVLSHTSGFQDWRSDKEPLAIHFTPGEKYMYSGEGYSYLQSVVRHLTGQTLDQFMRANVFAPFGMESAGYVWNDQFQKRMARPHGKEGKPMENNKPTDVTRYGAAGELRVTAGDYARFLLEVVNPRPSDAFRLTKASLGEMLRPHVKVDDQYSTSSWGLGFEIRQEANRAYIMHGGGNKGFQSFSAATSNGHFGYVIMTNGDNGFAVLKKLMMGHLNPFLAVA